MNATSGGTEREGERERKGKGREGDDVGSNENESTEKKARDRKRWERVKSSTTLYPLFQSAHTKKKERIP
jgi:hypothetical protein